MSRSDNNLELINGLTLPGTTPLSRFLAGARQHAPRVVRHELSRSGLSTLRIGESGKYIHSRYDPLREASRLASRQEGYLVVFGLGCGYLAAAAAARPEVAGVLAVEPSTTVADTVLREAELGHLQAASSRLRVVYSDAPESLATALHSFYTPALHEKISLHITEGYDSLLELGPFRDAFRIGVQQLVANYRTMARLGRSWTRNIVLNAAHLASGSMGERGLLGAPAHPPKRAVLLGAGPTLEDWIGGASSSKEGSLLLAADTALPALAERGIAPHLVASIDAQAATYHHYLVASAPALDPRPMLLSDLTAPPLLSRLPQPQAFFGGGHPLAELLLGQERGLIGLSTEGGNVGYSLLSAAAALGAEEIDVVGIDYAYLHGAAYARGSYLDHYFFSRLSRLAPLLSRWSDILYRDPEVRHLEEGGAWSYTDPRLNRFAESFRSAVGYYRSRGLSIRWDPMSRSGAPESPPAALGSRRQGAGTASPAAAGDTEAATSPSATTSPLSEAVPWATDPRSAPRILPARGIDQRLRELAHALREDISSEPRPPWLLSTVERALLPLAAWAKEHPHRAAEPPLEAAQRITLEQLDRTLS